MADRHIKPPATENNETEIRRRILDTAERLFAENGFDGTSVRSITTTAKCNLAAVNYHFGGKDKLYIEVFRRQLVHLREVRIAGIRQVVESEGDHLTLENLLHTFARVFIDPLIERSQGQHFVDLMLREMIRPIVPIQICFDEMFHPVTQVLLEALDKIFLNVERDRALRCIHSLIAQLLHVVQARRLLSQHSGEYPALEMNEMVKHIVQFSVAGFQTCLISRGQNVS